MVSEGAKNMLATFFKTECLTHNPGHLLKFRRNHAENNLSAAVGLVTAKREARSRDIV